MSNHQRPKQEVATGSICLRDHAHPAVMIDGPSGVGKTTIAKQLSAQIPGTLLLPEYTDMLEQVADLGRLSMPSYDSNLDAHREAASMWVQVDVARRESFLRSQEVAGRPCLAIVDTSPLMVIGFELLREQNGDQTPLDQILNQYINIFETDTKNFFMPRCWIFLEAPPSLLKDRLLQRPSERIHPLLVKEESGLFLQRLNRSFSSNYLSPGSFAIISTDISSPCEIARQISQVLVPSDTINLGLIRFIKELYESRRSGERFKLEL